jgi:hypothetical protein
MGLDETSRVIGQLEAAQKATQSDVAELKATTADMNDKLDTLLARTDRMRITFKHWVILLAGGSVGGGGLAHVLRKFLE